MTDEPPEAAAQPVDPWFDTSTRPLSEVVQPEPLLSPPSLSVSAAARLMQRARYSATVIVDQYGIPQGIWTEQDALQLDLDQPEAWQHTLAELMSSPVHTLPESARLTQAQTLMESAQIRHVVVVNADGQATGVISQGDLVRHHAVDTYLQLRQVRSALINTHLSLPADTLLSEAAEQMRRAGVSVAVVQAGSGETGLLTERDVIAVLARTPQNPRIGDLASYPLVTVTTNDSLLRAREVMLERRIRRLGVTDPVTGEVLGLLGLRELLSSTEGLMLDDLIGNLQETHHQLAESRQYYEQMFRNNSAPKLLIDPDTGMIADANPAALDFYGYSYDDIRQQRIQNINLSPDEEIKHEQDLARREQRRVFRFRHQVASGAVRDVEVHSGPIEVNGRTFLHSIIHDVTETQHYVHELERYKQIFDTLPVGVFTNEAGANGRFLEVNPAMVRIFDAGSPEALLQLSASDLYRDPMDRRAFREALLRQNTVHRYVLALQTLTGRPIWAAVSAQVRQTPDRGLIGDGVIEDITQQLETEQENRLMATAFQTGQPLMICTPDAGIVRVN